MSTTKPLLVGTQDCVQYAIARLLTTGASYGDLDTALVWVVVNVRGMLCYAPIGSLKMEAKCVQDKCGTMELLPCQTDSRCIIQGV